MIDETAGATGVATAPEVGHGALLARGALFNALAFLASNLRGIFTFLIARLLGSLALGTFGVAWAVTDLVSKFSTFGFETSVVAYIARAEALQDRAASRRIMRSALTIGLGLSVAIAAGGFWLAPLVAARGGVRPEVARATGFLLLALPGITLYRVSNAVSRGMSVMHHDIFSRGLTESLGTAAALLLALLCGARELAPGIAATTGTLASGCVAFTLARRLLGAPPQHPATNHPQLATFIRDSAAISVYDFLNIGIMRIDVIMLGLFVGRAPGVTLTTLGVYAAAVEVAGGARKINQVFNPIFTPVVARFVAGGQIAEAETAFAYLARWMLAILLPLVTVLSLAGGAVMSIYGPTFIGGASWLAIVSLACALNAFAGLGETILMVERPHLNLTNAGIALALVIVANAALIPAFGPLGAALGMLVPYTIYGVLRGLEITWLFKWRWPWRALMKPVAAVGLALLLALPLRLLVPTLLGELGAALCFTAAYCGAWRLIGLDPNDRDVINHLLHRRQGETSALLP
jgi:O-antigen/teichoic acid export membrane protein